MALPSAPSDLSARFSIPLKPFPVLVLGHQVFNIEQTRPGLEFRFYFEYEVGRKARGGIHWNASENVIAGSESGWGHLLREQQGECPLISLVLRESPPVDLRRLWRRFVSYRFPTYSVSMWFGILGPTPATFLRATQDLC
jgi:hypothetical protein